jgi:tripartite-type tricarboxylate transporter receptor subunit TctC
VPAGTPKPIVDKLYSAVAGILSRPAMKEMLGKQMLTVTLSGSPEEFSQLVRKETAAWAEVVHANKVKIN